MGIKRLRLALAVIVAASLSACVTLPPDHARSPQDPWESWNRGVYKFNDKLDRAVAKPVARGYVNVVPSPIRTGIHNFFTNIDQTCVMINDALQGKLLASGNDLGRFLLNSTVGLGGLFDPATSAGMDKNYEDFGLTLGHWGVHPGPFLELPLLGPSDLRDGPARLVDTYMKPTAYIKNDYVRWGLYLPWIVDARASLLPLDDTLKGVYDPYAVIRDGYLQHRAYLVSDGKTNYDDTLVDPDADNPGATPKTPAAAPSQSPPPPH